MSDQQYSPFPYVFSSKGLVALFARDRAPEGTYFNLEGLEVRQEGALSSRLGRTAITTDGTNNFPIGTVNFPVFNLARLKSTFSATYRYATGGGFFVRRNGDTNGAYTSVPVVGSMIGSTGQFSAITYRPSFSSTPYIFFADRDNMLKDSGTLGTLQHWGVLPPFGFVVAVVQTSLTFVLSAVANSSGGQAVYTGTITGGAGNAFAGIQFQVSGFVGANNNGIFLCVASTATTLTLLNAVATAEAHAATAIQVGPDVTGNGNSYDYRMTLYNQNTGGESNPTANFVVANKVTPMNQPVLVSWSLASGFTYSDAQVTHFRIYRRGGTLTANWLLIGTVVASATGSFLDTFPDFQLATSLPLAIDNDPPCTTALASQFNSTTSGATVAGLQTMTVSDSSPNAFLQWQVVIVDSGVNQEIVLVSTPGSLTQFNAFFQLPHASGVPVIVNSKPQQAMNLAAIGSQQAFLAGDPVNPNRLYYSKNQNPEAFPPQNYIEIGVPSDPIMAVVSIRGQVFVFTQSRVWRILSYGGGIPQPIPTGSRHGLSANFAWAIAEQSIIYLSYDGVYSFLADDSAYISEQIEWVFSDKQPNLGPLDPLDSTKRSSAIAAYNKGEFFLCYTGVSGSKRRMIYDTVNKRWRNDSVSCNAMFFEEDTGELIISQGSDGMIYKDRRSDWDQGGFIAGVRQSVAIPLNLETPSLDQGYPRNDKVYNEFTLDLDTGGSTLNVFLLFDNAATVVSLGTVGGVAGRKQVTFPINSGNGQVSKNVALRITGSVSPTAAAVHLYQWHIKAAVDAEQRKTYDSYWIKMGTDEFKFAKQGYFEYVAPDAGGITFNVYLEGSATASYSFNIPQTVVRTSVKKRFPAFKGKLWRFVATSASDFQLYGESFLEVKPITSDKGYGKFPFGQITAQGGV